MIVKDNGGKAIAWQSVRLTYQTKKKRLNSPSAVCTLYWPELFRWWHDTSDVVWEDCTPPCSYFQTHPIDLSLHVTLKHIPLSLWLVALLRSVVQLSVQPKFANLLQFDIPVQVKSSLLRQALPFRAFFLASIPGKLGSKLPKVSLS